MLYLRSHARSSHWNLRTRRAMQTALFLGTLGVMASPALAQGNNRRWNDDQLLFEWQGRVDKEIRVSMQGRKTLATRVGNKETSNGRFRAVGTLPRVDAPVRVQMIEGRGKIDIVQQPNARNGYVTIIRIRDPQSGQANYRIRVYSTMDARRGNRQNHDDRGRDRDRGRGGVWGW